MGSTASSASGEACIRMEGGLDVEPIRSTYEDDPDMMEIVREFAAELPDRVEALKGHLAAGELAELQTLAHQLRGAGGGYGFTPITEVAGQLEQALKDKADAALLAERTAALCDTLAAVVVSGDA